MQTYTCEPTRSQIAYAYTHTVCAGSHPGLSGNVHAFSIGGFTPRNPESSSTIKASLAMFEPSVCFCNSLQAAACGKKGSKPWNVRPGSYGHPTSYARSTSCCLKLSGISWLGRPETPTEETLSFEVKIAWPIGMQKHSCTKWVALNPPERQAHENPLDPLQLTVGW